MSIMKNKNQQIKNNQYLLKIFMVCDKIKISRNFKGIIMENILQNSQITVSIGKRVVDDIVPFHWLKISNYGDDLIIDKPVLLVFGGNGTTSTKHANGNAKIATGFIGQINESFDIVSVAYGENFENNSKVNSRFLAERLLLPLVATKNFERLPLTVAMKNMRRVNVFTHCAGTTRFEDVLVELSSIMTELNYSKSEQDAILGQIFLFGYAPKEFMTNQTVKQFYVQSIEDKIATSVAKKLYDIQQKNKNLFISHPEIKIKPNESFEDYEKRIQLHYDEEFIYNILNDNQLIYFTSEQAPNSFGFDHMFVHIQRDEQFQICEIATNVANKISVCIADTLIKYLSSSIENEYLKKPKPLEPMSKTKEYCDSIIENMPTLTEDNQPSSF